MIKNVLIIDDSVEIQMLLKMVLESEGYHIECTSNGEEALSLLRSCEEMPDVILLDLQMPVMDGLGFLDMHRKSLKLKEIPIVLMSGEDNVHETGEASHVAEVLKKPLNMSSVVRAVERNSRLH